MTYCFSVILHEKGGLQFLFIPAVHDLIDREGELHTYKSLGNLTDIPSAPLPIPGRWLDTQASRGNKKLVGLF